MHKLIISDDEGKTTVVPLVRDEITIGRKEGNTIRLTERNVSRRHARLVRANGSFQIEDLGSYNGIRLNGVRIADKSSVKEGDQIQIGDYQLALQSDKAVAKPPPEEALTVATAMPAAAEAATELIPVPLEGEETIPIEAPRPSQAARLVLVSAPAPGQEFPLNRDEMVIGRAEDCDVSINHRSMSREHAKILRVDQVFRILDLESANGVRVNGQDVPYAELRRGDVIELGHVRLRFVAPGEIYRFDGDATIQMSPGFGMSRSSRAPIWVLAAALLLAGGVALYLARPLEPVTPGQHTNLAPVPPPVPPAVPPTQVHHDIDNETLLEEVGTLMGQGNYDDVIAKTSQVLHQQPTDLQAQHAQQLLHDAQRLKAAKAHFDAAQVRLAAHDDDGALIELEAIDAATPQYDEADVTSTIERILRARLNQAKSLMRTDANRASELAQSVRDDQRVNAEGAPAALVTLRGAAEAALRAIDERLAQANPVHNPIQDQQQREQQREQLRQQREQQRLQQEQQQQQQRQQQQQQQQQQQEQHEAVAGTNPRDCGPVVSTTAARCFLAATGQGAAGGEYGLRNQILAYTLLGDRARARGLAARYFEAYGTSPFARQIRQLGYEP